MSKFKVMCDILRETMNCSAGITGQYESLPRVTKDYKKKKNYDEVLKGNATKDEKK